MDSIEKHIKACVKGDAERFEEIIKEFEPNVRAVIAAMVPDPNSVPDLTQEVFVIAYQKLDTYKAGTNFNAWIKTIARNVSQNARRSWYRRQESHKQYEAEAERIIAEKIDAFVENLPEETLDSLRDCVDGLGTKSQKIVDEYYYGSCSLKSIAELLNMSTNAAKVSLHRARQALGRCLQKKGGK